MRVCHNPAAMSHRRPEGRLCKCRRIADGFVLLVNRPSPEQQLPRADLWPSAVSVIQLPDRPKSGNSRRYGAGLRP